MSDRPTATPIPRILVFFDYACQFCYLDWPRFKRLRTEHDAELVLVPYELRPSMPAQGVPISELGGAHSERVTEHMHKMAEESGLELMSPDFVPNTHYALALGEYARDLGAEVHERAHEAIFSAYNASGRDIGSEEVLLDLATELGFDRGDVAAAFQEGRSDDRLHQFHHLALGFGITATPSALICNELFIGSRPYAVLVDALARCLVSEHNVEAHVAHGDDAPPASEA